MAHRAISSSVRRSILTRLLNVSIVLVLFAVNGAIPVYAAANVPPTLDPIANQLVLEDSALTVVQLTGISMGVGDENQTLTISAASSNLSILPDPTITYTSPEPAGSLAFTPLQNVSGVVDITVTVQDDGGTVEGGSDRVAQTFRVTIDPVNDPPAAGAVYKNGTRGEPAAFSAQDFLSGYSDVENDPLASIKIVSLPPTGKLILDQSPVAVNAVIPTGQLWQLKFMPASGWYGSASFLWAANDGVDTSLTDGTVNLFYPYSPLFVFLPHITVPAQPWVTAFSENFEGAFPGAWVLESTLYDYDGYYDVTSLVAWGKRSCRAFSGSYSGWAVGGGSIGSGVSCGGSYPDDIDTAMYYGPFSLSQAADAWLSIKVWADIEYEYDYMGWGVSVNNDDFYGMKFTGYSGGWVTKTLDLKNVYTLGNITGAPQVWLVVWFSSDATNIYDVEGVYVDNLVLSTCASAAGCTGAPALSGMLDLPEDFQGVPTFRSREKPDLHPASMLPANAAFHPSLFGQKSELR